MWAPGAVLPTTPPSRRRLDPLVAPVPLRPLHLAGLAAVVSAGRFVLLAAHGIRPGGNLDGRRGDT